MSNYTIDPEQKKKLTQIAERFSKYRDRYDEYQAKTFEHVSKRGVPYAALATKALKQAQPHKEAFLKEADSVLEDILQTALEGNTITFTAEYSAEDALLRSIFGMSKPTAGSVTTSLSLSHENQHLLQYSPDSVIGVMSYIRQAAEGALMQYKKQYTTIGDMLVSSIHYGVQDALRKQIENKK